MTEFVGYVQKDLIKEIPMLLNLYLCTCHLAQQHKIVPSMRSTLINSMQYYVHGSLCWFYLIECGQQPKSPPKSFSDYITYADADEKRSGHFPVQTAVQLIKTAMCILKHEMSSFCILLQLSPIENTTKNIANRKFAFARACAILHKTSGIRVSAPYAIYKSYQLSNKEVCKDTW